ncbi:MAG: D-alanyl-D-alanine endopeptidase [Enterobacteriaceae bacterium]
MHSCIIALRALVCLLLFSSLTATAASAPATQPQLASGSVLVMDLTNHHVLYSLNPNHVVPIASISKLMTAMVLLDAKQPMQQILPVVISDNTSLNGVFSRVKVNSELSREQLLLLTLMSSENRAATTLAHHYPGGYKAFIAAMNSKAKKLGMTHTHFVEPTGLSAENVSTASDLARLLVASQSYPLIGTLSTTREETVTFHKPRGLTMGFRNTNHLIFRDNWPIQLTKTGFTNQAGHCLVMRTTIDKRPVALVVLDAFGKETHFADASRLRKWLETGEVMPVPAAAKSYRQQKDQLSRNS